MDMTSKIPTITEVKNADDTNRWLLLWQGLTDTWTKLTDLHDHVKDEVDIDVRKHEQLLITGTDEMPSLLERVRNLEKFIGEMKDSIKYWTRLVVGAILLQTIAFGFGVVIAIVRFLPVLERLANKP